MDIINNTKATDALIIPDIKIKEHPKSKMYRNIYYIVFAVLFILGFVIGSGTNYNDGGEVANRYSENNGEYFPAHEDKYTGWYFLRFTFEGQGWQHNYFYDMGYSDDKTYWGELEETYPGNIALFVILNGLLVTAPFIFEFVRKKECENTELNIKEDRIYGSSGIFLMKKKIDIPFKSINGILVSESNADKLKSGKTLEVLYRDKRTTFSYIHNAESVKEYIEQCVEEFKNKKEEPAQTTIIQNDSTADELKKFKELLDSGTITQEEFEAKKKQLLEL